jgi:hypothetical protein
MAAAEDGGRRIFIRDECRAAQKVCLIPSNHSQEIIDMNCVLCQYRCGPAIGSTCQAREQLFAPWADIIRELDKPKANPQDPDYWAPGAPPPPAAAAAADADDDQYPSSLDSFTSL